MRESWERRIRRADELARADTAAAPLLTFYARLLESQKAVYDSLTGRRPSGSLERDATLVARSASPLLHTVAHLGPQRLATEARMLLDNAAAVSSLLLECWCAPSPHHFFAKAILQSYAQWLADAGLPPADRPVVRTDNRCPSCGGVPQLSILDPAGVASGDGSGRRLLCATCLDTWAFRRVVCPHCGEEDERRLCYYRSSDFDHLRVDACETCRHYLKSIDLGRLGLAVPLVDEVAGAPLDVWAVERGYRKIELNLVGL